MYEHPLVLDSDEWARVLEQGLGAEVLFIDRPSGHVLLAVFRAGPFKVAYPDFPVGARDYPDSVRDGIIEAARRHGVDVIRFQSELPQAITPARLQSRLGTHCIVNLPKWCEASWEKARRTRNRISRSPLKVGPAGFSDGPRLHQIYLETLARHGGSARYSLAYFRAIAPLATIVARIDGEVCAFVSFALHGGRACYLHGGFDPAARRLYPSDRLFYEMITQARSWGATRLDFLPSPAGQDSLAHYKEAWGAESCPFVVGDHEIRPFRAGMFRLAKQVYERLPGSLMSRML